MGIDMIRCSRKVRLCSAQVESRVSGLLVVYFPSDRPPFSSLGPHLTSVSSPTLARKYLSELERLDTTL